MVEVQPERGKEGFRDGCRKELGSPQDGRAARDGGQAGQEGGVAPVSRDEVLPEVCWDTPKGFGQEGGRIWEMFFKVTCFPVVWREFWAELDGRTQTRDCHSFRETKVAVVGPGRSQRTLCIILSARMGPSDNRSVAWVTKLLHREFKILGRWNRNYSSSNESRERSRTT